MMGVYRVVGMHCEGCVRAVRNAIGEAVPGAAVEVDLEKGLVRVEGVEDAALIGKAIDAAGFEFAGRA